MAKKKRKRVSLPPEVAEVLRTVPGAPAHILRLLNRYGSARADESLPTNLPDKKYGESLERWVALIPEVRHASDWLTSFVPIEGRPETAYRSLKTRANLMAWTAAHMNIERLAVLLWDIDGYVRTEAGWEDPARGIESTCRGQLPMFRDLTIGQSQAVCGLMLVCEELDAWFSRQGLHSCDGLYPPLREQGFRAPSVPVPIPSTLVATFGEASRVYIAQLQRKDIGYSSKEYAPVELRKIFDLGQTTLKKRLDNQVIRNICISRYAYRIYLADFPEDYQQKAMREKSS